MFPPKWLATAHLLKPAKKRAPAVMLARAAERHASRCTPGGVACPIVVVMVDGGLTPA